MKGNSDKSLFSALKAAHPNRRRDSLGISPPHPDNTQAYLSSLSSRLTSFFCFRVSSRLRRASASSLTARSRSRLRLSHRVLVEKGEVKVTVNGKNTGKACGLPHLSAPIPEIHLHQKECMTPPRPAHYITRHQLDLNAHLSHIHSSSMSSVAVEPTWWVSALQCPQVP